MIKVIVLPPEPPVLPPPTYRLEMSADIAQLLIDITYVAGGTGPRRQLTTELYKELKAAGLKENSDRNNGYYPPDMERQPYVFR
jgi:hypothetical protein